MKPSADETGLFGLLETLGTLSTGDELTAWADTDLQAYFPHGAFICGVGRIYPSGVQPIRVFSSRFPLEYLRALEQPNGYLLSPVMKNWLDSGEVQLLDKNDLVDARLDRQWLEHFKASGLQNIAAHGAHDLSRQYTSYFSFHQIAAPLGEWHRRRLKILVPSMHLALLRIIHLLKEQSRAARPPLTERELEVLTWVCDGKTSAEIATILGISLSTVRNQIQSTLVKLKVSTRTQAVAKALKKGLVVNRQQDSQFGGF